MVNDMIYEIIVLFWILWFDVIGILLLIKFDSLWKCDVKNAK